MSSLTLSRWSRLHLISLQLLGREYYQTAAGHALLVSLPILVHTASGIAKRVASPQRARRLTSLFTLTGYATLAFFLPIHYLLHRVYPRDPAAPVYELAPSELDFEYVKYGLQRWPWRSWFLYAGLTVCVAWHAAEGMQIIWNTWLRGSFGGWKSSWGKRLATVAAVVVPTLSGLYVVFREPLMAFTSSLARYEGAFTKSFVFKL